MDAALGEALGVDWRQLLRRLAPLRARRRLSRTAERGPAAGRRGRYTEAMTQRLRQDPAAPPPRRRRRSPSAVVALVVVGTVLPLIGRRRDAGGARRAAARRHGARPRGGRSRARRRRSAPRDAAAWAPRCPPRAARGGRRQPVPAPRAAAVDERRLVSEPVTGTPGRFYIGAVGELAGTDPADRIMARRVYDVASRAAAVLPGRRCHPAGRPRAGGHGLRAAGRGAPQRARS